jgi:type VI secretion system secreted protein Hcp
MVLPTRTEPRRESKGARVKKILKGILLVLGFIGCTGVGEAIAQTDTFMLVPGIKGSSTDDRHKEWIDVVSLSHTLEPAKGRPQCTLAVVKGLDNSGPLLWAAAVTGQVFGQIQIDVTAGSEKAREVFYQVKLNNATVTTVSTNVGSGAFSEVVTLAAGSVELLFFPQRTDGSLGTPVKSSFTC